MMGWPSLFAATSMTRTYFELMRLRQLDEWWHWLLLAIGCVLILAAVTTMYLLDTRGLARGKRWLLLLLRILAFVGLLAFFLDLQKRTEQKLIKNSRFTVLVDTSQSMGIADIQAADSEAKETRIRQVTRAFAESTMLASLREKHDVSLYRFDATNQPVQVAMFSQTGDQAPSDSPTSSLLTERVAEAKQFWTVAFAAFALSILALLSHFIFAQFTRNAEGESWALLVAVFTLIVGLVLVAVSSLRNDVGPLVAMGWAQSTERNSAAKADSQNEADDDAVEIAQEPEPNELDWPQLLEPRGGATRLGDAVRWVLAQESGNPLAGIGVMTDGNSNRGIEIKEAASISKEVEVPLFPIGIASDLPPTNVRFVDVEAPARVYPGDEFRMTGYVQGYGLAGETVNVQMVSRPADVPNGEEVFEADIDVQLGLDGEVIPVPIQVRPEEVGRRVYSLKVGGTNKDPNTSDNEVSVKIRIIDRKSRVLLIAGGPTREYRFLRNMLYRDKDTTVDVLLQTAVDGISQEADEILFDLPREPAELFEYDTIVAFDPEWANFDQSQLELIEQWVAEKAGGLVAIAGPVHMSAWAEDRRAPPQISTIRQLYPVNFNASRVELGRYGSETAWPLEITEDGKTASFLQLSDVAGSEVEESWSQFAGVYGYYPVREVKPAATVFARYSDPQASITDEAPPLIVGQFYGAGRVMFLGTGEFWRLRALDSAYFERFYTKLIRYVSEGRLLRDSNRGLLLVEKDRALRGDSIGIRATVVDEQFQPLRAEAVDVTLRQPDKSTQTIALRRADGVRDGMYTGRFMANQAGDYQLELTLPGEGEPIVLEREVRVKLPNLEIERPQRNDADLQLLASETGGKYYVGIQEAIDGDNPLALTAVSKRRETFLPGTPDRDFQLRLRTWLLAFIVGALFLEWLIRRLSKLA